MSRIDDSDNQRIREMQEQELRARKDAEKKDADSRISKSFQEVMRERTQKQTAQKAASSQQQQHGKAQEKAQAEQGSFAQQLLKRLPKEGADLQKRAAMSRAMASNMSASRSQDAQKAREAEADRVDDLVKKADDDKERVEKEAREEGERETQRAEERDAKFHKVEAEPEDRGGQKDRHPQKRHDSGHGEKRAEGTAAVKETKQEAAPRGIPPEVMEKIVSAIHKASHADGRTELQVELKGTMLEGVRLKVRADRGKVSCTFEGADKELKNLLESSKGALMRSLEKRGLTLTSLKVV
jgi:hypothetical protein